MTCLEGIIIQCFECKHWIYAFTADIHYCERRPSIDESYFVNDLDSISEIENFRCGWFKEEK
jgi:hypothetical protein